MQIIKVKMMQNQQKKITKVILMIKNIKKRQKILIYLNLGKTLSFNFDNLKNNEIKLTTNQIKRLLQKIRERNFPNNDEYLKDISKINITFEKVL